jgi:uncharacterized protein DUF1877
MSMAVSYLRVAADHIELLQKDPMDALHDLNPNAYYPDRNTVVGLILENLPGDIEELNLNDTRWLAWLRSPAIFEEKRRGLLARLFHKAPSPALDLPVVAILGSPVAIEGRDVLRLPALDSGLGRGTAFDPTTVQKLSTALSQIIPDDLLRNFDYDAMQRIGLPGFGVPGSYKEEERATEERLARESVGDELWQLQEFYRRAAASGQYVIVHWS